MQSTPGSWIARSAPRLQSKLASLSSGGSVICRNMTMCPGSTATDVIRYSLSAEQALKEANFLLSHP